jgi:hypothetical protein
MPLVSFLPFPKRKKAGKLSLPGSGRRRNKTLDNMILPLGRKGRKHFFPSRKPGRAAI